MTRVSGVGRRGTRLLCKIVSGDSFCHGSITGTGHSQVGIPFRLTSDTLSGLFLRRSFTTNLRTLGNRHIINKVHTSVCGTVPLRNIGTLASFVIRFRHHRNWYQGFTWSPRPTYKIFVSIMRD